jgi:hemerythrin-like domain-containing protein
MNLKRRDIIAGIGVTGGLILSRAAKSLAVVTPPEEKPKGGEVTAVEDLMREHGVLRRALFVYSESAGRLRKNPSEAALDMLQKTARLFRAFGENYHEKKLEEEYIFPAIKKAGGPAAGLVNILIAQHNRGREITDYILNVTQEKKLTPDETESLARSLEAMVQMYRPHAAREDTVVFPAWKMTLTERQLDEMGDKFEDIEREMLGKDGFENAIKQIADIETWLGLADLSQFTAPPPSK